MNRARIIVLVAALGAGGLAVKLVSMSGSEPPPPPPAAPQIETVDVLAAAAEIRPGQVLSTQNIGWQAWPSASAGAEFVIRSNRPDSVQELSGARARTAFAAGEPIRPARLAKAGSGFLAAMLRKGMRAVAMEITPENGAGSFVLPGDHVDVILTRAPVRTDENFASETILWNIRVLAIDQDVEEKSQRTTAVGRIATLEVSPMQAETLALARRLGTVSLVLRGLDDFLGGSEETANLGRRDGINTVRYGVSTITLR